jgi:hypothetical protein
MGGGREALDLRVVPAKLLAEVSNHVDDGPQRVAELVGICSATLVAKLCVEHAGRRPPVAFTAPRT